MAHIIGPARRKARETRRSPLHIGQRPGSDFWQQRGDAFLACLACKVAVEKVRVYPAEGMALLAVNPFGARSYIWPEPDQAAALRAAVGEGNVPGVRCPKCAKVWLEQEEQPARVQ